MATGGFSNLVYYFEQYGVLDFLLPFLLVFTITYAIISKSEILGKKKDAKGFHMVLALSIATLFVVPHITGYNLMGYDPVEVLNNALPSISLIAVAGIMFLILTGTFFETSKMKDYILYLVLGIMIFFVIYVFGASLGFWNSLDFIFDWWNSELTSILIMMVVFSLILFFVTRGDGGGNAPAAPKAEGSKK